MIKTEQLTINNKQFTKTYSDSGFMVERDGALYSEADDFAYQQRVYTETDIPIDPRPETDLTINDTRGGAEFNNEPYRAAGNKSRGGRRK